MKVFDNPRAVTEVDREIGDLIRARREALGAPQRQVAAALGISHQQLQKYEAGDSRVSAAALLRIARVLGSDAADFLPETERKRAKSEDSQAVQLQEAFKRIRSQKERRLVLDLALRLSQLDALTPAVFAKRKSRR